MVWLSITARNSGHNRVDNCKVASCGESKCGKNCYRLRFIETAMITLQTKYFCAQLRLQEAVIEVIRFI